MNASCGPTMRARVLGVALVLPPPQPATLEPPAGLALDAGPAYFLPALPDAAGVSPNALRRVGRSQRLMLAAAAQAVASYPRLSEHAESVAVTVGTGLGTLGETVEFLEQMIAKDEREPKPTRFMNAVHNAAASQVAVAFGFRGENRTFIHESISFELALWQAVRLIEAGRARFALVGGVDEISPYVINAGRRYGWWRSECAALSPLDAASRRKGTLPGEGACAILLGASDSASPGGGDGAVIAAVRTEPLPRPGISRVNASDEVDFLRQVLASGAGTLGEVDFLMLGANGDASLDDVYRRVAESFSAAAGRKVPRGVYKQMCGEFCAASGVGIALVARAVCQKSALTDIELAGAAPGAPLSNVVVYNLSRAGYHSACYIKG